MTDNLFKEPQQDPLQIDPNKDYWTEYTGPGGKFHDPDETKAKQKIAAAKAESDNYIKHLLTLMDQKNEDIAKMSNELNAGKSLREMIEDLRQPQQQHQQGEQPIVPQVNTPSYKPEELQSLFSKEIEKHEDAKRRRDNMQIVQEKLAEKFGSNYQTTLRQQAKELGINEARAQELAQESPNAFFRMFGIDAQQQEQGFNAPPRSTQRSDPFAPKTQLRDWAFYEKMRKEQPSLYHNPKTHVQMHKDANEIDEKFGPGTFMGSRR